MQYYVSMWVLLLATVVMSSDPAVTVPEELYQSESIIPAEDLEDSVLGSNADVEEDLSLPLSHKQVTTADLNQFCKGRGASAFLQIDKKTPDRSWMSKSSSKSSRVLLGTAQRPTTGSVLAEDGGRHIFGDSNAKTSKKGSALAKHGLHRSRTHLLFGHHGRNLRRASSKIGSQGEEGESAGGSEDYGGEGEADDSGADGGFRKIGRSIAGAARRIGSGSASGDGGDFGGEAEADESGSNHMRATRAAMNNLRKKLAITVRRIAVKTKLALRKLESQKTDNEPATVKRKKEQQIINREHVMIAKVRNTFAAAQKRLASRSATGSFDAGSASGDGGDYGGEADESGADGGFHKFVNGCLER